MKHTNKQMSIKVQVREVYGRELIYPACKTSKLLVELTGCKTWTQDNLRIVERAGIRVEYLMSFETPEVAS